MKLKEGQMCSIHHQTDCCGRLKPVNIDELRKTISRLTAALDEAKDGLILIANREPFDGTGIATKTLLRIEEKLKKEVGK